MYDLCTVIATLLVRTEALLQTSFEALSFAHSDHFEARTRSVTTCCMK